MAGPAGSESIGRGWCAFALLVRSSGLRQDLQPEHPTYGVLHLRDTMFETMTCPRLLGPSRDA